MAQAVNTPVTDASWLPAVLVLIFAVPIGAFLSLFAALACFLFQSVRESLPVVVLGFLAFSINGCALLLLFDSDYNSGRFLVAPLAGFVIAVAAAGVIACRGARFWKSERESIWSPQREPPRSFLEDR